LPDKDFSPSLSQSQNALTGFEPMLGTMPPHFKTTLSWRLRTIIVRMILWQQPRLLRLLDDPDPKVRKEAARKLRIIGDSRAVPRLLRLLEEEEASDVRQYAIWVLSGIGDHRADPAIVKIAQETEDPKMKMMALFAIGEMQLLLGLPLLVDHANHSDPGIRQIVVNALGMLGSKYAIDPILLALHDPHPAVRRAAVVWAGEFRDPRAIEGLEMSLHDPLPHTWRGKTISETAAEALKKIGTPEALVVLKGRGPR
jgi:HEAT repeat protein